MEVLNEYFVDCKYVRFLRHVEFAFNVYNFLDLKKNHESLRKAVSNDGFDMKNVILGSLKDIQIRCSRTSVNGEPALHVYASHVDKKNLDDSTKVEFVVRGDGKVSDIKCMYCDISILFLDEKLLLGTGVYITYENLRKFEMQYSTISSAVPLLLDNTDVRVARRKTS